MTENLKTNHIEGCLTSHAKILRAAGFRENELPVMAVSAARVQLSALVAAAEKTSISLDLFLPALNAAGIHPDCDKEENVVGAIQMAIEMLAHGRDEWKAKHCSNEQPADPLAAKAKPKASVEELIEKYKISVWTCGSDGYGALCDKSGSASQYGKTVREAGEKAAAAEAKEAKPCT